MRKSVFIIRVIFSLFISLLIMLVTNIVVFNYKILMKYKVLEIIEGKVDIILNPMAFKIYSLESSYLIGYGLALTFFIITFFLNFYKYRLNYRKIENNDLDNDRLTTLKELKQQYKQIPLKDKEYPGNPGVVISRYKDKLFIDDSNTNVCLIGTTRSGKGETFILPSIDAISRAENKASIVANDPKGELCTITNESLKSRGYDIQVLNLFNPNSSMGWNPITDVYEALKRGDEDEAENIAGSFTFGIYKADFTGSDTFWVDSAADTVSAMILALAYECIQINQPEKLNMYNITLLLSELSTNRDSSGKSMLDKYFESLDINNPGRKKYGTLKVSESKTRASILAVMISKLGIFTFSDIARMTSKTTYDLRRLGFNIKERFTIKAKNNHGDIYSYYSPNNKLFKEEQLQQMLNTKKENGSFKRLYSYQKEHISSEYPYGYKEIINKIATIDETLKRNEIDSILESLYSSGYINNYASAYRYYASYSKQDYLEELKKFNYSYLDKYKEQIENFSLELSDKKMQDFITLKFNNITDVRKIDDDNVEIIEINDTNECLIPLKGNNTDYLTEKEKMIYDIICERFLENMIGDCTIVHEEERIDYHIPLVRESEIIIDPGFKVVKDNSIKYIDEFDFETKENDEIDISQFEFYIEEAFKNKPTALYMVTPDFDKTKHVLASIFISQLYTKLNKECINSENGIRTDRTIYFFLDEFGSMPMIESMDSKITVNLSRWIIFILVIQSYEQLKKYKEAGKVIKENCGYKIYIQSDDEKTTEEISKSTGIKNVMEVSRSGKELSSEKSQSEHLKERRVLSETQVRKIKMNESIVIRTAKRLDNKKKAIKPYAIYNTGKTELLPRWKYLDNFKSGISLFSVTNKLYGENTTQLENLLYVPKFVRLELLKEKNKNEVSYESVEKTIDNIQHEESKVITEDNVVITEEEKEKLWKYIYELFGENESIADSILASKEKVSGLLNNIQDNEVKRIAETYINN